MAPEVINSKGHTKSVDLWSVGVVLHILLVGYPPFQIDSCNDLKMKAIAWQYGLDLFSYEGWESISVQAKHLVTQLLALDPAKRITAAAALKHPWLSGSDDVKPVPFGATHSRHIKRFAANMQRETARARSLWTREAFFSLDNSLVVKDPVEFTSPVHVPGAFKQPDSAEVTPEKSDMESSETKADDHFDGPKTASAQKRRLADDTPWRPRVVRPYVDSPSSPLKFSPASSRRGTQPAPSSSPSSRQMSGKKHNRSAEQLPAPHKLSRTGSSPKTVRACTKLPRQCIDFETNPFPPF